MTSISTSNKTRQSETRRLGQLHELPGDILHDASTAPGERRTLTSDPGHALAEIADAYSRGRLEVHRSVDFELDLRRFAMCDIELSLMSVGTNVELVGSPPRDRYIVAIPVCGHVTVGSPSEVRTLSRTMGVVMSPNEPVFFSDWSTDYRHLCVRIDRATVDSALGTMLRRPIPKSTEFAFPLDVSSSHARPLLRALELAALEITESDSRVAHPVMSSSISQLVVNALLLSQDHSFSAELNGSVTDPELPTPLRLAQRFIVDQAGEPITVRDVANAANLSVRALEEGFSRFFGMPPMTYVRNVRLQLVRDELRRMSPDETTVSTVAQRWGFRHAGRFSATYRARFGVAPSHDLYSRSTPDLAQAES